jgi:hypothetical protein
MPRHSGGRASHRSSVGSTRPSRAASPEQPFRFRTDQSC